MAIWDELKKDLIAAEGRETRVYRDSLGYPTCGIGHLLTDDELDKFPLGTDVSDEQIGIWYLADEKKIRDAIAEYFGNSWGLFPDVAKLAVANWLWQLGANAPSRWHRATEAIQNMDWATAADEFEYTNPRVKRLSEWYHQTPSRCRQEVDRLRAAAKEAAEEQK